MSSYPIIRVMLRLANAIEYLYIDLTHGHEW